MTDNPYQTPDETNDAAAPKKRSRTGLIVKLLAGAAVILVGIALLLPAQRGTRESGRGMQCANNLKQIALALHNYEQVYHALPPACTFDEQGNPLHSWRTLILPFLEQQTLYETIDLTKPWHDPANQQARETRIPAYSCPSVEMATGNTTYLAVVSPGSCLQSDKARRLSEVTDEHGLTLIVAETDYRHSVFWMEPVDIDEDTLLQRVAAFRGPHPSRFHAVFVNGDVRALDRDTPAATLKALVSIAGNDPQSSDVE